MLATILFFLIAVVTALWGAKAGLTAAGKFLLTMFIAAFAPLWTLDEAIRLCEGVPPAAAKYLPAALLLLEAFLLTVLLTLLWRKLAEKFVALDDSPALIGMPRVNALFGAAAGGAAGHLLAGTLFMVAALLPVTEIPVLGRAAVVRRAEKAALFTARAVNRLGRAPEMAARQREFLDRRLTVPAPEEAEKSAEPKKGRGGKKPPPQLPARKSSAAVDAVMAPVESAPRRGGSSVYGNSLDRARKVTRSAEQSRAALPGE